MEEFVQKMSEQDWKNVGMVEQMVRQMKLVHQKEDTVS